jgi:hypothetical protein
MDFINPLDLKVLIVDTLLGGTSILFYFLIILISFICAKFGMSNRLFLIILVIACLLFASYIGQAAYILILMVIGFISFKAISRLIT